MGANWSATAGLKIKQQRPSPPNIEQNKQNLQCPTKQLTFPSVSSLSYKIFINFSLVGQKKLLLKKQFLLIL